MAQAEAPARVGATPKDGLHQRWARALVHQLEWPIKRTLEAPVHGVDANGQRSAGLRTLLGQLRVHGAESMMDLLSGRIAECEIAKIDPMIADEVIDLMRNRNTTYSFRSVKDGETRRVLPTRTKNVYIEDVVRSGDRQVRLLGTRGNIALLHYRQPLTV